jgi:hypothetical protein
VVVLVFGTSAAICATMPSWPSPAMFVLGTVALPFLALGAALPTVGLLTLVWVLYRAVDRLARAYGPSHHALL